MSHTASKKATPAATASHLTGCARALRNAQVMAVVMVKEMVTIELIMIPLDGIRLVEISPMAIMTVYSSSATCVKNST